MAHPPMGGPGGTAVAVTPTASGASAPGTTASGTPAPGPYPPHHPPPARGSAWAEGRDRLRAAATTEPGRLRVIGAVLAVLVIAFGAVTAWQVADRKSAADDVVTRSQPLSADAASIYRSLADADTAAASGFLAGAQEPPSVIKQYNDDIAEASRLLVKAAANTSGTSTSGQQIATLNQRLPQYTGLIERARANNRQGLPLGGAYLRYANEQMTTQLLPAAKKLYDEETDRLYRDYDDATAWPYVALGLGVLALGGLGWAQLRNYRRTNRVFNHGLLGASVASVAVLLWLVVGHTLASSGLGDSRTYGQESLKVLSDARISSLQARANENLTLVSRGAVSTAAGGDKYEADYTSGMADLEKQLTRAGQLADDDGGKGPVQKAADSVKVWKTQHKDARATDDQGDYDAALKKVIGESNSTGQSFVKVDQALASALEWEQREFTEAAEDGRGALSGLAIGAAVLAVLAAGAALLGIGRRLSEFR
ncbi:hypothetical protein ACIO3O_20185 [Streptomyces sp. NPDC087440]|uniref:hypothetical protein n=1 Tax=Streptomyces sp. NPDC087440 TaxID=3365790 RepID=UPI0038081947